ncbi:MAG: spermidine/putrescine ABC transporter permease PotC [Clostridiales bacterium 43-6]|nr:MAG: spermidine/putrescine ABC transporter permease PotC [Clostridiales bacterium 43-6]
MKQAKEKIIKALGKIHAGLILLFLYLPIMVVVVFSFNTSKRNIVFQGFTLEWYGKIFENQRLLESFKNTIIVALTSTVITTVIGTIGAIGLYKYKFKGKGVVDALMYIPVVIPEIILGIALLSIFAIMKMPLGILTLIIAHVTFSIPFVVFTVRARLNGFDPSIEEAAMDLGAGRIRTFFEVTLPCIMPGVLAGAMLALTLSMDDVIISFFTTGPTSTTLPMQIYSMVRSGVSPDVNALSTLILVGTIAVVVITQGGLFSLIKTKITKKKI